MKTTITLLASLTLLCSIALAQVKPNQTSNFQKGQNPIKENQSSTVYTHPDFAASTFYCQIDSVIDGRGYNVENLVVIDKKYYYANNANGQPISITEIHCNRDVEPLYYYLAVTYALTYNAQGKLIDCAGTDTIGTIIIHETYSYDANGNETEYTMLKNPNNIYSPNYNTVKTYNAANQLLTNTRSNWNGTAFALTSRKEITYDGSGKMITEINYTSWDGAAWTLGRKTDFTFNGSGQITSAATDSLLSGVWVDYQLINNVYDANAFLITVNGQSWDGTAWIDSPCPIQTITNNAVGNPVQVIYDYYYQTSCYPMSHNEYTYYPNDSIHTIIESLNEFHGRQTIFDQYGNITTAVFDWGNDFTPEFPLDITNTYYSCGYLGINSASIAGFDLYPNPTTGQFALQLPTSGKYEVEVFNTLGQEVYAASIENTTKHTISLSNAPTGIYTVRIKNDKTSVSKRVVIE